MFGKSNRQAEEIEETPEVVPEALIFVRHHFIQYTPYERPAEPWLLSRLSDWKGFYVATKEQALQLMERSDEYKDQEAQRMMRAAISGS